MHGSVFLVSVDQILTHHYAEKLLYLRLCFRKAKECARKGIPFGELLHVHSFTPKRAF